MRIIAARRSKLRRGLVSLFLCAIFAGAGARANELQDAHKFLKTGQHREALERVNKALAAKPNDPQARFLKGVILTEQGNMREAIDIFTRLTQDFPELPEPFNNLAVIYAGQGQYDRARVALEQSIRSHPSYAVAYENLGDVYARLASEAYDKAVQIDKSNTVALNKLSLMRQIARSPSAVR
jgi:tetratricopeptide (TPR) repeat protein